MNLHKLREELFSTGQVEEFLRSFTWEQLVEHCPALRHSPQLIPTSDWLFREPERMVNLIRYEAELRLREIIDDVPYMRFPSEWEVRMIPPFAGATARFGVKQGRGRVSVYLDWHGRLGVMDSPYWEIYPDDDGHAMRYALDEIDGLLDGIQLSLDMQNAKEKEDE